MQNHRRFHWAAETLEIKPQDRILEIGCGVGLAVEEIVPQLGRGKIIAIDRSENMIQKAVHRNKNAIAEGKAEFLKTDLLHYPKNDTQFNKIFCFNINFFWTQKSIENEAAILKSHLMKNGLLYIFYGPMVASGIEKIKEPLIQNLQHEKISVIRMVAEEELNCCCFECRA